MTNTVDIFSTPNIDLKGWWLVDSLDGRRWVGKLVSHGLLGMDAKVGYEPALLSDEIVLHPAFEVPPDRILTAVPAEADMSGGGALQARPAQFAMFNVDLLLNVEHGGLVPQRVRRSNMHTLSDWDSTFRGKMRQRIGILLEKAKPQAADTRPEGPREKVH